MCGISGFFSRDRSIDPAVQQRIVKAMTDEISHRGPDDEGFFNAPGVALGHRRLSIIDVSTHGHQPMFNETNDLAIIYNGEIYNHADLRPSLEAAGHRYRSHCDTETIIHAYEQQGADCVRQFRGMFSSQSTIRRTVRFFALETDWASSLCTTILTARFSSSVLKSKRCCSIPR